MNNLQNVAIQWVSRGVSPVPIVYKSKIPSISWRMWQDRVPPIKVIEYWFRDPKTNIALICGGKSNLAILDFDDINSYYDWRKDMMKRDDVWRNVSSSTYRVRTPRGMHLYINTSKKEKSRKYPETSIDVRCSGNYTLAPPSIHPSGNEYVAIGSTDNILTVDNLDEVFPDPNKKLFDNILNSSNYQDHKDDIFSCTERLTIQEIKSRINILSFTSQFSHVKKGSTDGRFWWARCINPAHNDRHPSFSIDTKSNRARCLSVKCKMYHPIGLDVIDLYKIIYGVNTRDAIVQLSSYYL